MGASPITRAPRFSNLRDVDLSGLADGDAMLWNASTGKWEPGAAGGVQYAASGAGTENRIQVPNASQELVDSALSISGVNVSGLGSLTFVNSSIVTPGIYRTFNRLHYNCFSGDPHVFTSNGQNRMSIGNGGVYIDKSSWSNAAARTLEVRDNSGNPQQRWAYDASNYGERYVNSTGDQTDTITGTSARIYNVANNSFDFTVGNTTFSHLKNGTYRAMIIKDFGGTNGLEINTQGSSLILKCSNSYSARLCSIENATNDWHWVMFDRYGVNEIQRWTKDGEIGFFGETPTTNPVVRYGLSGAGTENSLQVPNASGDLFDTGLHYFDFVGNPSLRKGGTSSVGPYWGNTNFFISEFGVGNIAAFRDDDQIRLLKATMVGSDSAPTRMLTVSDNSGNPQERLAYDGFNYGERYCNPTGHIINTSTGNRFEFVHSSGGGEIILAPTTTSFALQYSPTATSSVISVLTATVDYAWLGQSGKNTLIGGSRLGFFVGSSSQHVAQSTGWTIPATYTTRKTFSDSSTVTLAELADVVATLITTLGDTSGYRLIAN